MSRILSEKIVTPPEDPADPPLLEALGTDEALRLVRLGYRVVWKEPTPEALQAARRLLLTLPFVLQNRIEGIALLP